MIHKASLNWHFLLLLILSHPMQQQRHLLADHQGSITDLLSRNHRCSVILGERTWTVFFLSSLVPLLLLLFRSKFNWRCLVLSFGGQLNFGFWSSTQFQVTRRCTKDEHADNWGRRIDLDEALVGLGLLSSSPPLIYQWIELALHVLSFVLRMFGFNFIISQINVWTVQELYFKHIISVN